MCGKENQIARLKVEDEGNMFDAVDFNAEKCVGRAVIERYGKETWGLMKNGMCGQVIDILYIPDINEMYGNIQFKILDCR